MAIYVFVLISHLRLAGQYGGSRVIVWIALVTVLAVFALLMIYQWRTNRGAFYGTWIAFGTAFLVEAAYRRATDRTLQLRRRHRPA